MNIVFGALIVVVACAVTISAMLLVRRRAPEGSYFSDGDRASGVFGVLASGFALLLGFMIFLAFQSYDESRSGAETEATLVVQQVETAQFLPKDVAGKLTGELMCYGRSVVGVGVGCSQRRHAHGGAQPVGGGDVPYAEVGQTTDVDRAIGVRPVDGPDQPAGASPGRPCPRSPGNHAAAGVVGAFHSIAGVILVYMLFFADPGEGAITQSMLMGGATVVIVMLMLLLMFFDHPHGNGLGRLQPTAMQRSLSLIADELDVAGLEVTPPCDQHGRRV